MELQEILELLDEAYDLGRKHGMEAGRLDAVQDSALNKLKKEAAHDYNVVDSFP